MQRRWNIFIISVGVAIVITSPGSQTTYFYHWLPVWFLYVIIFVQFSTSCTVTSIFQYILYRIMTAGVISFICNCLSSILNSQKQ
jgi:hypothetical protein